ncbi:sugar ABC transporter permease [Oceanispirochaeta sp. M1]|uniref:ABC transporter permease n=1 Tax=unclassified Oceanispirochaeta TaxID=2635722 RepID=UPI0018F34DBC|nr:ABC transporter permease subunit [Oceanispirochaeta sp. M1]
MKYLMMLPGIILLILINYLPMFGNIIAFKEIDYSLGILKSPWIGFENFTFMFANNDSWIAIRNTLGYNITFIITNIIGSVALAIGLNEVRNRRAAKIYQVLIIMPHFISMVVVSYLVYAFLGYHSGYVNDFLKNTLHLEPISWYMSPQHWPFILIIVNSWKAWGYGTVIYLATMMGFDPQIYEAATIDGAGRMKQIMKITIPLLMPIITLMFILSLGRIFNSDFGLFYQVTRGSGALIKTTQTLDTLVYRSLILVGDIGMSSAAALFQSFVGFLTIITFNMIIRKMSPDRAMF